MALYERLKSLERKMSELGKLVDEVTRDFASLKEDYSGRTKAQMRRDLRMAIIEQAKVSEGLDARINTGELVGSLELPYGMRIGDAKITVAKLLQERGWTRLGPGEYEPPKRGAE